MNLTDLCNLLLTPQRKKALKAILSEDKNRTVRLSGLSGSAASMLMASLPAMELPVIVVGDSLDDAGYLYHDLSRILGEESVLMFPSGYKRAIKYGQVDPPSQIMRNEVLNHWGSDSNLRFVVTYPEALAEKVASKKLIDANTIRLTTGKAVDLTETQKWLRANGFQQVDYVYDPGHFAVRGSILDIFGYSHEKPFRIDFFGDEIESIRTFNIETQLSETKLESIAVTSATASTATSGSLLDFT